MKNFQIAVLVIGLFVAALFNPSLVRAFHVTLTTNALIQSTADQVSVLQGQLHILKLQILELQIQNLKQQFPASLIRPDSFAPVITSLTPQSVVARGQTIGITVTGSNFIQGTKVFYDGNPVATDTISPNELETSGITLPVSVSSDTPVQMYVLNPDGQESNTVGFLLLPSLNPQPEITSIDPISTLVGFSQTTDSFTFKIIIYGNNFIPESVARFDGGDRPTELVQGIHGPHLRMSLREADVSTADSHAITVFNPLPGGGESNPKEFNVENPDPDIDDISPSTVAAGSGPTTITIRGSGFINGSRLYIGGALIPLTYISSSELRAVVPASSIATEGAIQVRLVNPTPGGGVVEGSFEVLAVAPVPVISTISPQSIGRGGPNLLITISGTGFLSRSVVKLDGRSIESSFASSTEMKAIIHSSSLGAAGTHAITVFNPAPGGGISNGKAFIVSDDPAELGTLIIKKEIAGSAADATFRYTMTGALFVSDIDDLPSITTSARRGEADPIALYPGAYQVFEIGLPQGYEVVSSACINQNSQPTGTPFEFAGMTTPSTIDDVLLLSGSTVTCTFVNGLAPEPAPGPTGGTKISFGQTNDQIFSLQTFLNAYGFHIGIDPTGYFGERTRSAVQKLQCANTIVCSGDETTTGYGAVGPKTADLISKMSGGKFNFK